MRAPGPVGDERSRAIASALLRCHHQRSHVSPKAILTRLGQRESITGSLLDETLEAFLAAGWVQVTWRIKAGGRRPFGVCILDEHALAEHAEPGGTARRREALALARDRLAGIEHPVPDEVRRLVAADEEGGTMSLRTVAALAVVAAHAATGDVIAARVLSARDLGDSKAIDRVRAGLERRIGPLVDLGIREGSAVTLIGGAGRLVLPGIALEAAALSPFHGLSRETLASLERVELPSDGLVVVENLTVFEACCRGEAGLGRSCLFVWSAGYPGRGVRALVEAAANASSLTRCWADLDLDGVRIARLVGSWAGASFEPLRMDEAALLSASARRELSPSMRRAIEADVVARPDALLAPTLQALLREGIWVEQEALLGAAGRSQVLQLPIPGDGARAR